MSSHPVFQLAMLGIKLQQILSVEQRSEDLNWRFGSVKGFIQFAFLLCCAHLTCFKFGQFLFAQGLVLETP